VKASAKFFFKKEEEKASESELQMAGAEVGVVTHEIWTPFSSQKILHSNCHIKFCGTCTEY